MEIALVVVAVLAVFGFGFRLWYQEQSKLAEERRSLEEEENARLAPKLEALRVLKAQAESETAFLKRAYRERYAYQHFKEVRTEWPTVLGEYARWEGDADWGLLASRLDLLKMREVWRAKRKVKEFADGLTYEDREAWMVQQRKRFKEAVARGMTITELEEEERAQATEAAWTLYGKIVEQRRAWFLRDVFVDLVAGEGFAVVDHPIVVTKLLEKTQREVSGPPASLSDMARRAGWEALQDATNSDDPRLKYLTLLTARALTLLAKEVSRLGYSCIPEHLKDVEPFSRDMPSLTDAEGSALREAAFLLRLSTQYDSAEEFGATCAALERALFTRVDSCTAAAFMKLMKLSEKADDPPTPYRFDDWKAFVYECLWRPRRKADFMLYWREPPLQEQSEP